jgi:hypothetical protein
VLRDDDMSDGDNVEQLTYLLFLKMADERSQPPYNQIIFKSRPSCAGAVQADCGGFRG